MEYMEYISRKFVDACRSGDLSTVRQLIAEGVDINDMYEDYTGLMAAIYANNKEIVDMLLTCPDINVNIRNNLGRTALYKAMVEGNSDIVSMILSRADTRLHYVIPLVWSVVVWSGETVLQYACRENKAEFVKKILEHPSCNKDIVNKKDHNGKTAAMIAEDWGYHGCVGMIRDYLANDEYVGACLSGDLSTVRQLIVEGVDINGMCRNGNRDCTGLMGAIWSKNMDLVNLLLTCPDIDVNIRSSHRGDTALWSAIWGDNAEIVRMLLSRGDVDVNITDNRGRTALVLALWKDNKEIVRMLLSRGDIRLDITTRQKGETVLHFACRQNKAEYVQMMLAHPRCNKDIVKKKNKSGKTAETIAEDSGDHGCIGMIREYLANDEGQDEEDVARSVGMMALG